MKMILDPVVSLDNLVLSVSDALDLVHPEVNVHQQRVAYLALRVAEEMDFSRSDKANLMYAATLHDIGILSVEAKVDSVTKELQDTEKHCIIGNRLLSEWSIFEVASDIVRWHHTPWEKLNSDPEIDERIALLSNLVHLADTIDLILDRKRDVIVQIDYINETISKNSGTEFAPELVSTFLSISRNEALWLDLISPRIYPLLKNLFLWPQVLLTIDDLEQFGFMFSRVVDLRSRFTATHSMGVATVASNLAKILCFSEKQCRMMLVAGYLHDLGKVDVPASILEKKGPLDENEFNIMRAHSYHTYRILSTVEGFEEIAAWAAFHHERLDGNGYPFHLSAFDLPLGSRIMSVADVFTAISEDRPYRKGMKPEQRVSVLNNMTANRSLDRRIVEALLDNVDAIDTERIHIQTECNNKHEEQYLKLI